MTEQTETASRPAHPQEAALPVQVHSQAEQRFAAEVERLEGRSNQLSMARLLAFLGAALGVGAGLWTGQQWQTAGGALLGLGFFAAVTLQMRVLAARDAAQVRRDIHRRHLDRIQGQWPNFADTGTAQFDPHHAYAWDVDLVGRGSLFQRIDVTRTRLGEQRLCQWLGAAAPAEVARARQLAVQELADDLTFRQELEAAARLARGDDKLDERPFAQLTALPSTFDDKAWLVPALYGLPLVTLGSYVLTEVGVLFPGAWLLPVALQVLLLLSMGRAIRDMFDLAEARTSVVEAFEQMLLQLERANFDSGLLRELQERVRVDAQEPSSQMRRLHRWVGYSQLRKQVLFHLFINPLTLWDLHVLRGLEAWNRDVGQRSQVWFEALSELEALCSLATLRAGDPQTCFPELVGSEVALEAEQLAHPLLTPHERVANDLRLRGPTTALIVTGSNMAGKSTLLRSVGLNLALALAGGPVCAQRMRVPRTRLRASMRAQDNLQQGASYFHAELSKLKTVVEDAETAPPVFFLLDELLRGTNARARHVGAKAVLFHLLKRNGTGLVATHDVELARVEGTHPQQVQNVHFTDVVEHGEMRFDYRLRPGIVRTSNALRLLSMAGIDVPAEERESIEGADPEQTPQSAQTGVGQPR